MSGQPEPRDLMADLKASVEAAKARRTEGVGGSVGADLANPCGKPCTIAPMVGGKVYGRVANRCWHEGGLWHDFTNGQDVGADLAAIEARLAKATPGPWAYGGRGVAAGERIIAQTDIESTRAMEGLQPGWLDEMKQDGANGNLIAHAPSDVASLLALVRQLQGQLDAARAWLDSADPYPERNGDHFAELRIILAASSAAAREPWSFAWGVPHDGNPQESQCDHAAAKCIYAPPDPRAAAVLSDREGTQ